MNAGEVCNGHEQSREARGCAAAQGYKIKSKWCVSSPRLSVEEIS